MRAFIAIELPDQIKAGLAEITDKLKSCDLQAKWVKQENIHLTLKFLGEIKQEQVPEITSAIETTGSHFTAFKVSFTGFGFFPNEKKPRVFFVTTDKEKLLKEMYQTLEEKLQTVGFEKEERVKAHLTLARFKGLKNLDCLKKQLSEVSLDQSFPVAQMTLFKSTLTRSGPIYQQLAVASLKTNPCSGQ